MFSLPKVDYTDNYDLARFKLTWTINVSLVIGLFVMSIIFSFVEPRFVIHYGLGFVLSVVGLIRMKSKKSYREVALYLSVFGMSLVISSIFMVQGALHYIEPFWMLNISFYSYFTLGKKWGNFFLVITILTIVIYFTSSLNDNVMQLGNFRLSQTLMLGVEFTVCVLIMGYIIFQFLTTTAYAESQFRSANDELEKEKSIVELQNQEKTILLKEIHHRVKNNLQVITSLLKIQASRINSEEAKASFDSAIKRIMSMSLIHQRMYARQNLSEIELEGYFQSLLNDLVQSNQLEDEIKTEIIIDVSKLGVKTLVPVALIITELVSNSLKYAFSENGEKVIRLEIHGAEKEEFFDLKYSDNGKWRENERPESFGLSLVESLTNQLEGSFDRQITDDGTSYNFKLVKIETV